MGWVNGHLGGVPAIFHDGDEVNFHTMLLIEPETRWGAILLVNANSAMPIGSGDSLLPLQSLQDGIARLLAGQPPQTSLSLATFYLIFDGVLAILLTLAIFPLLRLRHWSRRFGQRRHRVVRFGLRLTWEVALPIAFLLGFTLFARMVGPMNWNEILLLWPDVGSWVLAISTLLLLTGILRAVLAIRVLQRTAPRRRYTRPGDPSRLRLWLPWTKWSRENYNHSYVAWTDTPDEWRGTYYGA